MHVAGSVTGCIRRLSCCERRSDVAVKAQAGSLAWSCTLTPSCPVTTVLEQDLFYSSYTLSVFSNIDKFLS